MHGGGQTKAKKRPQIAVRILETVICRSSEDTHYDLIRNRRFLQISKSTLKRQWEPVKHRFVCDLSVTPLNYKNDPCTCLSHTNMQLAVFVTLNSHWCPFTLNGNAVAVHAALEWGSGM